MPVGRSLSLQLGLTGTVPKPHRCPTDANGCGFHGQNQSQDPNPQQNAPSTQRTEGARHPKEVPRNSSCSKGGAGNSGIVLGQPGRVWFIKMHFPFHTYFFLKANKCRQMSFQLQLRSGHQSTQISLSDAVPYQPTNKLGNTK